MPLPRGFPPKALGVPFSFEAGRGGRTLFLCCTCCCRSLFSFEKHICCFLHAWVFSILSFILLDRDIFQISCPFTVRGGREGRNFLLSSVYSLPCLEGQRHAHFAFYFAMAAGIHLHGSFPGKLSSQGRAERGQGLPQQPCLPVPSQETCCMTCLFLHAAFLKRDITCAASPKGIERKEGICPCISLFYLHLFVLVSFENN